MRAYTKEGHHVGNLDDIRQLDLKHVDKVASFTAPRAQMLIAAGVWWLFNPRRLRVSACETSVITGYRLVLESIFNVACELSEARRHSLVLA